MQSQFPIGSVVKLTQPQSDAERDARYVVAEDNGRRIMIRLVCSLPITPVETVRPTDIERA